jgi:hypothetical protein
MVLAWHLGCDLAELRNVEVDYVTCTNDPDISRFVSKANSVPGRRQNNTTLSTIDCPNGASGIADAVPMEKCRDTQSDQYNKSKFDFHPVLPHWRRLSEPDPPTFLLRQGTIDGEFSSISRNRSS